MPQESPNSFEAAQRSLDAACERLGVNEDLRQALRTPRRQVLLALPVLMDDGTVRGSEAYLVHHALQPGPALAAMRCSARAGLDEARGLALRMTARHALLGLPYGGAVAAVACDPRRLSRGERERLTRRYAMELAGLAGRREVLTADLGVDAQAMAWVLDTCAAFPHAGVFVAGRPTALGGSAAVQEAAARGVLLAIREACQLLRKPLRGATVALSGCGRVGAGVARLLQVEAARVVAVGDSKGGVYASRGLEARPLLEHKHRTGSVVGLKGAERVTGDELLETKCDVLVLAAVHGQVQQRNAARVRARIVAETAPGGTTAAADRILHERGALVVPDLLCGGGSAVAAHLEQAHEHQGPPLEDAELQRGLEVLLRRAFQAALERSKADRSDLRSAAWLLAAGRLAEATRVRGLFP